jgi:hypothetical protein
MKTVLQTLTRLLLCLLCTPLALSAQSDSTTASLPDSLEVGLLTCTPGRHAYDLYGHTAIRVRSLTDDRDFVFNYGVFDFRSPNFVSRFIFGKTDYTIGVVPFRHFAEYYAGEGRSVEEQVLDLTREEAITIVRMLDEKVMQHGWTYRYNFLYDNCTTRAISTIERSINGVIRWPSSLPCKTTRGIIHEYASQAAPWTAFGQDLLLGAEVDRPIERGKQMFAPFYAKNYLAGAIVVTPDGQRRPLVRQTLTVVSSTPQPVRHAFFSPLVTMWLILFFTIGICLREWQKGKIYHLFDGLVLLVIGGLGCLVTVVFFCSEHPSVGSNWLIFLFNPLPLLYLPFKFIRLRHGRSDYAVPLIWTEVLLLLLVFLITPQYIPAGIYILTAAIGLRGLSLTLFPLRQKHSPTARQ